MKTINKFLIISFIALLLIPNAVKFLALEDSVNIENRNKNKIPEFEGLKVGRFVDDFDNYYKESFGLRDLLFCYYSDFKISILNESPLPDKGYVGKKDWLFLGNFFGRGVKEQVGINPFEENELRAIRNSLLSKQHYLDSLHIRYYPMVAPNKQTIYPEYLPYPVEPGKSKLDQLTREMKKYPTVHLIDLKAYILSKKDTVDLYHRTDSHWNRLGAFIGFEKIASEIAKDYPELKPTTINDFKVTRKDTTLVTDISKMLNQQSMEIVYDFQPLHSRAVQDSNRYVLKDNMYNGKRLYEQRYSNPDKKLKVLVFGDSFTVFLTQYFVENFGEVIIIGPTEFMKEIIEKEKPDLVIHEVVERDIDKFFY